MRKTYEFHLDIPEGIKHVTEDLVPKEVTSVSLPKSCEAIGDKAFQGRTRLHTVKLSSALEFIGEQAFAHCENLVSIDLSLGVKTIGFYAFTQCKKLRNIFLMHDKQDTNLSGNFKNSDCSLVSLDWGVFDGCSNLEWLALPKDFEALGHRVFTDCSSLDLFIVPDDMVSTEEKIQALKLIGKHHFAISEEHKIKSRAHVIHQTEFLNWKKNTNIATRAYSMAEFVFLYRLANMDHVRPSMDFLIHEYPHLLVQDLAALTPENKRSLLPNSVWQDYGVGHGKQWDKSMNCKFFKGRMVDAFPTYLDLRSYLNLRLTANSSTFGSDLQSNNKTSTGLSNGRRPLK
ncbi:MAG: leucine-rich repeat domain-containing protein [Pseudomonadota bacterium]|nr:leucine-rich repeat domain-containing protein [Pseudomonadota bacterium]